MLVVHSKTLQEGGQGLFDINKESYWLVSWVVPGMVEGTSLLQRYYPVSEPT
jgi:hypothetical protein